MRAHRALEALELGLQRLLVDRVDLGERDDLGLVGQAFAISRELAADGAVIRAGVFARRVDEVDERAATLDMTEETIAEPLALVRALDEAGNVGEDEIPPVDANDAEARMERREGIVGDLRLARPKPWRETSTCRRWAGR